MNTVGDNDDAGCNRPEEATVPMNTTPTTITVDAAKVRRLRGAEPQHRLANRAGLPQSFISGLECGRIRRPQVHTLAPLARALGVPVEELLQEVAADVTAP
jgi:predicted transcriptional regulator